MPKVLPTKNYARIKVDLSLPALIDVQLKSFQRLKKEGLADLFNEISPIESYNKGMKLYFPSKTKESEEWELKYWFDDPKNRKRDYITLKFNRKRMVPITIFLRALAAVNDGFEDSPLQEGTDEELFNLFQDVDNNPDRMFIASTIAQEPEWEIDDNMTIAQAALIEFFKRMRPGDPATLENAREFLEEQLFDKRLYDLERVGRYKLNQKLDLQDHVPSGHRLITKWDIVNLVRRMIAINNNLEAPDDIDHLGNRRAKTVGELIQNKLRIGLRRMERVIKERMSIRDQENISPITLINVRPLVASLNGSN